MSHLNWNVTLAFPLDQSSMQEEKGLPNVLFICHPDSLPLIIFFPCWAIDPENEIRLYQINSVLVSVSSPDSSVSDNIWSLCRCSCSHHVLMLFKISHVFIFLLIVSCFLFFCFYFHSTGVFFVQLLAQLYSSLFLSFSPLHRSLILKLTSASSAVEHAMLLCWVKCLRI